MIKIQKYSNFKSIQDSYQDFNTQNMQKYRCYST